MHKLGQMACVNQDKSHTLTKINGMHKLGQMIYNN